MPAAETLASTARARRTSRLGRDLVTPWLELYDERYLPFRDLPERDANACEILLAIE